MTTTAAVSRQPGRLARHFPGGQFARYLCVGVFNTLFGYCTFAITLFLLSKSVPERYLYLTVIAATAISTPLNITVSFLGYKYFVFRSRGHFLTEWLRCFGVYRVGMLPGVLALSGLTRLLQSLLQSHQQFWHSFLNAMVPLLHGHLQNLTNGLSSPKALAGYIAGALLQGFTIVFSFFGHQKVTFRHKSAA